MHPEFHRIEGGQEVHGHYVWVDNSDLVIRTCRVTRGLNPFPQEDRTCMTIYYKEAKVERRRPAQYSSERRLSKNARPTILHPITW